MYKVLQFNVVSLPTPQLFSEQLYDIEMFAQQPYTSDKTNKVAREQSQMQETLSAR